MVLTPVGDFRGGAERSVLSSVEALAEAGYKVSVITSNEGELFDRFRKLGAKVYITNASDKYLCIGKKNFIGAFLNTIRVNYFICKLHKQYKIDLIYCNDALTVEWCIGALLLSLSRRRPKILVHERLANAGPLHRLNYFLLQRQFRVIFTSKFMEKTMNVLFKKARWGKTYVLHNPIDMSGSESERSVSINRIRCNLGLQNNERLVCYVGRFAAWKNIHHILEAMYLLQKTIQPHLLVVGKASGAAEKNYEQFLQIFIKEKGLNNYVHFVGYHNDVAPFIKESDVLILPSSGEPFGRVVVEAQSCGIPVIGARSGGIPEILDKRLGVLVDVGNIEQLASAIDTVLGTQYDKSLRERVASDACERFNSTEYKRKFRNIVNSYLKDSKNAST